ncbi:MAG: transketolase C-terminal domain-containing protein [Blautia marasmi]
MPNYTILTPADGYQTYKAVQMAAEINGPVYVRAGSGREANVYEKDAPFSPEGITILREYGDDTLLLSSGFVLERVLAAADLLKEQGVNVTVGDINILYGKNPEKIVEAIKKAKKIVTVEDHNENGGLGAYISKLATEHAPKFVKRMGLTTFGESGAAKELADFYGFSPENIAKTVKENL